MKIKNFVPVPPSEVPEMKDWLERVLLPIYTHLNHLSDALQTSLVFEDNFYMERRDIDMPNKSSVEIVLRRVRNPVACLVGQVGPGWSWRGFRWSVVDENRLNVIMEFNDAVDFSGSAPTAEIPVRFLIF